MTDMLHDEQPGTLVWVGPTHHPEFADAFQFCRANAAQIAVRRSPSDLVSRPAGFVKRILFARVDRSPMAANAREAIVNRYGDADCLALTSSVCDGEGRTGAPWGGMKHQASMKHLRFSRWAEQLPQWLAPCGHVASIRKPARSTLVIADRYEAAEPYLNVASSVGMTIHWKRNFHALVNRNTELVIWDDSVAKAASVDQWRIRLCGGLKASNSARHVWLLTQPNTDEIKAAISGGVADVFTKPVAIASLF